MPPSAPWPKCIPYRDDPSERGKFAETFMPTDRNLTRQAREKCKRKSASRFKKQTAELCNVHRLWKLFGLSAKVSAEVY